MTELPVTMPYYAWLLYGPGTPTFTAFRNPTITASLCLRLQARHQAADCSVPYLSCFFGASLYSMSQLDLDVSCW